jgi:tRNA G18 (ribose-2'-O)-methylase SpoU
MGSIFARPPARAAFEDLPGTRVAFRTGAPEEWNADSPVVLCFGSERGELPGGAELDAGIPMRPAGVGDGPDSLNVAMAATVALYDRFRMARHG